MKKLLTTITIVLFSILLSFAHDIQIDGLGYNLNYQEKTAEVVWGGLDSQTSITIPPKLIRGNIEYTITSIGGGAFQSRYLLTHIEIPNTVTSIGGGAFNYCISLTSVEIPESVTSIGADAFSYCKLLSDITIPKSITNIGAGAFHNTQWFNNQPEGFVYINNCLYAYRGKMQPETHIEIREGTTQICGGGIFFNQYNLTSVNIPNSVTSIGDHAFGGTSITSIVIPNGVKTIETGTFLNCSQLNSVSIPNSVTTIKNNAFEKCTSLTSITIPNSVTTMGNEVFNECYALTSIVIPNSVTNIGWGIFDECFSLKTITLSENITNINALTFRNCKSLTSISIPNNIRSIRDDAFYNCSSLSSITIPQNVDSIGESIFAGCHSLSSINVVNDNPYFASIDGVLYDKSISTLICCPSKKDNISIPNTVTNIEGFAFRDCASLPYILIPNNVTTIGESTFENCTSLKSISIPNKVKSIKYGAFTNCTSLKYAVIGNSVDSIGMYAFSECDSLSSVVIGKNVSYIAPWAFENYGSLTSITCLNPTPPTIDNYTFQGVSHSIEIKVPQNSIPQYKSDEYWSAFFDLTENNPSSCFIYTTNNSLHIEGLAINYKIYTPSGKLVYEGNEPTIHLTKGIYIIAIGDKTQKIIL